MVRRLFVATTPDAAALDALLELIATLRRAIDDPGMRWQAGDQLHLTWRFLGDTDDATEPRIGEALAVIARGFGPIDTHAAGWQYWPSSQAPRVLVLRLEPAPANPLRASPSALAARIEDAARHVGFAPETKPFRAHLTLARIGRLRHRAVPFREPPPAIPLRIDHIALVQSTLGSDRAHYVERMRWPLPGAPAP